MKLLFPLFFFTVLFSKTAAQNLSTYSYSALDSLMYIEYNKGAFDKALIYVQAGRDKAKAEFGEMDSLFADYTSSLGYFYDAIGNNEKAEALFLQALNIQAKILGEQHSSFGTSLNNLAYLYHKTEQYEKAEPLYLQAINIYAKTLGEEHPHFANSLSNLAGLYESIGSYGRAELLLVKATKIYGKVLGEDHPEFALNLNNLASIYQNLKRYKEAEDLYLKSKEIFAKTLGKEHPEFARSLNNLAVLYNGMGYYEKAERLLLQAKNIYGKILGEQHPEFARSLHNLSNLYKFMGKLDTALLYCHQSIMALSKEMDSNFKDWENLDKFKYSSTPIATKSIQNLLEILDEQYKKTGDKNKLVLRYQIVQAAIRLNERIRNEFSADNDKLRNLAVTNDFVLAGIETGLKLLPANYVYDAFAFAEKNKGVLLMDAAKTANAYRFGDLPDSLAIQEQALQKQYADLEAKLSEKRSKVEKDSLISILNKTNQEIELFTKRLKTQYPKYASLRYENKSIGIKEVQSLLDEKTALLEYVIGDSVVYIFYIDKKNAKLIPQYIGSKDFAKKSRNLYNSLSSFALATKESFVSYQKYTENAFWFYENLVAPALKNAKGIEKLVIIPDGELGHLPFEAFLVEKAPKEPSDYKKLHYLLNDYKISYNYSATLWKSNKEAPKNVQKLQQLEIPLSLFSLQQNTNNGQLLAMTANYEITMDSSKLSWRLPADQRLRATLRPLPFARKEVDVLSEGFNGYFGYDKNASEKNFKEKAVDFTVIHLAMHGTLDNKNPILSSLAFTEDSDSVENNFLHAFEISKMKLKADLVVLSACETGYGHFDTGNGITSIAQAFAYAGAPALIVSLWQVNDQTASEIMKNLYQNLTAGMEKDEALQQAKLQFIREVNGLAAHPAFWSSFVQMGNTDPIYLETKGRGYWWWIIGIGVLVLGVVAFRMKKKFF